jgi:amino-acid N-acetyltransferase
MTVRIERARGEDLPEILALLGENELPQEALGDHLATTLVAREGPRIVGSAALELYGPDVLLRSVAVCRDLQGCGLGRRLTRTALDLASERGVVRAYLLTETAVGFFLRFGFRPISRSLVPQSVQRSVEFVSACPASARAMVKDQLGDLTGL